MSPYDDTTTDGRDPVEDLLSQALTEQADTVEPSAGALQEIQRRTPAVSTRSRTPWVIGSLGAGLAAAAVITAVVLIGQNGTEAGPPIATQPSQSVQTGGDPTLGAVGIPQPHQGVYDPTADAADQFTMYYVGPQPDDVRMGPRLFAETHTVSEVGVDPQLAAVNEFLTSRPIDSDYHSYWPTGTYADGIEQVDGATQVDLHGTANQIEMGIVLHPTSSTGVPTATASMQALLRTMQADGPVTFTYNGEPVPNMQLQQLPVTSEPDMDVRAWITIDNVVEGQTVSSPVTVEVSGNVFEGTVSWSLTDANGNKVKDGYVTTSMGTWSQAAVDLRNLSPGAYTFTAWEASAEDGHPINTDDKTFTVE